MYISETCENADCGPNKRCVIRRGRPKCICSPLCKASKDKKTENNFKVVELIDNKFPLNLSEYNIKIKPNRRKNSNFNKVEKFLKNQSKSKNKTVQSDSNKNLVKSDKLIMNENGVNIISNNSKNNIRHRHKKIINNNRTLNKINDKNFVFNERRLKNNKRNSSTNIGDQIRSGFFIEDLTSKSKSLDSNKVMVRYFLI